MKGCCRTGKVLSRSSGAQLLRARKVHRAPDEPGGQKVGPRGLELPGVAPAARNAAVAPRSRGGPSSSAGKQLHLVAHHPNGPARGAPQLGIRTTRVGQETLKKPLVEKGRSGERPRGFSGPGALADAAGTEQEEAAPSAPTVSVEYRFVHVGRILQR